jgi:hypothetical protein
MGLLWFTFVRCGRSFTFDSLVSCVLSAAAVKGCAYVNARGVKGNWLCVAHVVECLRASLCLCCNVSPAAVRDSPVLSERRGTLVGLSKRVREQRFVTVVPAKRGVSCA